MTLSAPVVRPGDWATLQTVLDIVLRSLPALQGVGRVEYGTGSIDFDASETATVDQAHTLGVPPLVVLTSRDDSVVFAQPAGVIDTTFPVAARSLTGSRSDTVEFNYIAIGHVTT